MKELTRWTDEVIKTATRPKFTQKNMQRHGKIVGLVGAMQSGKDTFGKILVEECNFTRIAFADRLRDSLYLLNPKVDFNLDIEATRDNPASNEFTENKVYTDTIRTKLLSTRVQDIVDKYGWEKAKQNYSEIRRLLRFLGTESGRDIHGQDCWVNIVKRKIEAAPDTNFVITDVRFKNELDMIHSIGGITIQVIRTGFEPTEEHSSEMPLEGANHVIFNDSTLEEFEKKAKELLTDLNLLIEHPLPCLI